MRLIEADRLLEILEREEAYHSDLPQRADGVRDAIMDVMSAPTVDAVPVRHGRWVMKEGELAFWDECSECGKKIVHRTPYYDFCPNCGANMRKDGNDGKTD